MDAQMHSHAEDLPLWSSSMSARIGPPPFAFVFAAQSEPCS